MSGKEQSQPLGTYYTIVEGKFRRKVNEDHEGAVRREWSTPDGKSGVKHELVYNALFGIIESVRFVDGDYGKQIMITLDKDEDGDTPIIALSVNSKYGVDFLKKLPAIKLDKEVRLMPFNFKNDKDEEVTGLRVDHKDDEGKFKVKVENYFFDGTKTVNGFPDVSENEKKSWGKEDWKNYFSYVIPKFLVAYATDKVIPNFSPVKATTTMPDYPEEVINPEDIPF